jgi:hypothetical protein
MVTCPFFVSKLEEVGRMHLIFLGLLLLVSFIVTVNQKDFRSYIFRYLFIFITSLTYIASFYLVCQAQNELSLVKDFTCIK